MEVPEWFWCAFGVDLWLDWVGFTLELVDEVHVGFLGDVSVFYVLYLILCGFSRAFQRYPPRSKRFSGSGDIFKILSFILGISTSRNVDRISSFIAHSKRNFTGFPTVHQSYDLVQPFWRYLRNTVFSSKIPILHYSIISKPNLFILDVFWTRFLPSIRSSSSPVITFTPCGWIHYLSSSPLLIHLWQDPVTRTLLLSSWDVHHTPYPTSNMLLPVPSPTLVYSCLFGYHLHFGIPLSTLSQTAPMSVS